MKSIEQLMIDSGWQRQERINDGKVYVEFVRDGFLIDEDDIVKLNPKEKRKDDI